MLPPERVREAGAAIMTKHRKQTALAVALFGLALTLSGCGSLFGKDYSGEPDYQSGYTAGCGTGTGYVEGRTATVIRDRDLWAASEAYRAGWKSGFNACRPSTPTTSGAGEAYGHGRGNGPGGY